MTAFPSFVEELEARAAIEDALKRYCRGMDRLDWDMTLSAFHEDAYDFHGASQGTIVELIETVGKPRHENIIHSAHTLGQIRIEFASPTLAASETYGIVTQMLVPPAPDVEPGMAAARIVSFYRYVDKFEQRQGQWRIVVRRIVPGDGWTEQLRETPGQRPGMQRRDGHDPIVELERELGIPQSVSSSAVA